MTTALRRATLADIDQLVALETRVFDADRISRRSFRQLIERDTAETIVAETGGRIDGYAMVLFRKGTAVARLYSIAVLPEASGRGLGAELLQAAEDAAYEHGRMVLRLEVREDNAHAIGLYERRGYRRIGRYLDYYADHTNALRYEKLLRGARAHPTPVPYYEQTADFTCGPCCLMMAKAHYHQGFQPSPLMEIRLWREATTVFMLSGPGGCEPHGMAVTAALHGLDPAVIVSEEGPLFLQSVRSEEKRRVMDLAQADFRQRAVELGIPVSVRAFTLDDIRAALAQGKLVAVLVSGFMMFGKKVPHWVLAIGDDGSHIFVHDPWVEDEAGETVADAANIPIPHAVFMAMAQFGRPPLRAAIILGGKRA
ncbi:GNAT family N-acetyltransferase [Zhengella mangrovi]|uniref:GNAT family N-acetyltransferase n=1 Tax=Zhengella mangrovi TaxID=1982044 RepID=A0A2G1QS07_9HYPH|nr:GNAT family N-acetyltransferase/peptidase C39 family protein [Zhengella mangrovi]PHP68285.1 GNAT family N-acetyltransferase [Zhengella mangrovi]